MAQTKGPKGPWINRMAIRLFTLVFALLVFWVLGFLVDDIGSIRGPQYSAIEREYVEQELVATQKSLQSQIARLGRTMTAQRERMKIAGDSSRNLQKTIGQLIELQKLTVQKSVSLPEADQGTLAESLKHFLESQKRYHALNTELSEYAEEKRRLEAEKAGVDKQIDQQRRPARDEYNRLAERHRIRLAFLKLAVLVPLLAVGGWLVRRKRSSIYSPLVFAYGGAVLLKVGLVAHEYFPKRYFKYVLILVLLAVVGRLLIHFIRVVAFPKVQWLTKQYREAYERFLCPICEFPVRTGPRRFLYWTRRTVNKAIPAQGSPEPEPYCCPSCGTMLYEECPSCHGIRHSLLPNCRQCGAAKSMEPAPAADA